MLLVHVQNPPHAHKHRGIPFLSPCALPQLTMSGWGQHLEPERAPQGLWQGLSLSGWPSNFSLFVVFSCKVMSYSFTTPWTVACQAPLPWDLPGKNTGVGCHFLLQGILPTLGPNAQLLHWQVDFSPTEPPGKPEYSYLHLESGLAFDLLRTVEWSRNEVVWVLNQSFKRLLKLCFPSSNLCHCWLLNTPALSKN